MFVSWRTVKVVLGDVLWSCSLRRKELAKPSRHSTTHNLLVVLFLSVKTEPTVKEKLLERVADVTQILIRPLTLTAEVIIDPVTAMDDTGVTKMKTVADTLHATGTDTDLVLARLPDRPVTMMSTDTKIVILKMMAKRDLPVMEMTRRHPRKQEMRRTNALEMNEMIDLQARLTFCFDVGSIC